MEGHAAAATEIAERERGRHADALVPQPRPKLSTGANVFTIVLLVATGLMLLGAVGAMLWGVVLQPVFDRGSTETQVTPSIRPWFAVAAAALLLLSAWAWRRRWSMQDIPTLDVAGARPGVCELVGAATPISPDTAWFTGATCIRWRARVQRLAARDLWATEWEHVGGAARFRLVGDDGGTVDVDLDGSRRTWARNILTGGAGDRGWRVAEDALVAGDRLYVLGTVEADDDGLVLRGPRVTQRSERGQLGRLRIVADTALVLGLVLAAFYAAVEARHDDELAVRENGAPRAAATAVLLLALALVVAYGWRLWNRLVQLREQAAMAWAAIDVAAQRRHDTIGRLVSVTSAAADHEHTVTAGTAVARGRLPDAAAVGAVEQEIAADAAPRAAVVARVEAAPSLGADAAFAALFAELRGSEDRLAAARRFYGDAVTVLADRTRTWPGLLLKPFVAPTLPPLPAFDLAGPIP